MYNTSLSLDTPWNDKAHALFDRYLQIQCYCLEDFEINNDRLLFAYISHYCQYQQNLIYSTHNPGDTLIKFLIAFMLKSTFWYILMLVVIVSASLGSITKLAPAYFSNLINQTTHLFFKGEPFTSANKVRFIPEREFILSCYTTTAFVILFYSYCIHYSSSRLKRGCL